MKTMRVKLMQHVGPIADVVVFDGELPLAWRDRVYPPKVIVYNDRAFTLSDEQGDAFIYLSAAMLVMSLEAKERT